MIKVCDFLCHIRFCHLSHYFLIDILWYSPVGHVLILVSGHMTHEFTHSYRQSTWFSKKFCIYYLILFYIVWTDSYYWTLERLRYGKSTQLQLLYQKLYWPESKDDDFAVWIVFLGAIFLGWPLESKERWKLGRSWHRLEKETNNA